MAGWLDGHNANQPKGPPVGPIETCPNGWMDGWMARELNVVNAPPVGSIGTCPNGWMDGWMDIMLRLDGWMARWLDDWMAGWLVGWMTGGLND